MGRSNRVIVSLDTEMDQAIIDFRRMHPEAANASSKILKIFIRNGMKAWRLSTQSSDPLSATKSVTETRAPEIHQDVTRIAPATSIARPEPERHEPSVEEPASVDTTIFPFDSIMGYQE